MSEESNKRIHAQRKFAQGAAVLPSKETVKEPVVRQPVQSEPRQGSSHTCNKTAEDLLTMICIEARKQNKTIQAWKMLQVAFYLYGPKVLFCDTNIDMATSGSAFTGCGMKTNTQTGMPMKNLVVVLSDIFKKPSNTEMPKEIVPFAVRKTASKRPLSKPALKRKMAQENKAPANKIKVAKKISNVSSTLRKSPRISVKPDETVATAIMGKTSLYLLRNRGVDKKTVSKVIRRGRGTTACNKFKSPNTSKKVDVNGVDASLEKSFDDSDEEPLARRITNATSTPTHKDLNCNSKKRSIIENKNTLTEVVKDVYEFSEEPEPPLNNDSEVVELNPAANNHTEIIQREHHESASNLESSTSIDMSAINDSDPTSGDIVPFVHSEPSMYFNTQSGCDGANDNINCSSGLSVDNNSISVERNYTTKKAPVVEIAGGSGETATVSPLWEPPASTSASTLASISASTLASTSASTLASTSASGTKDVETDADVICMKKTQLPTVLLQTQFDTIMQQMNLLKTSMQLESNKKTPSGSKTKRNTVRCAVRPYPRRGRTKVAPESIPKIPSINATDFPKPSDSANIVEAPVFMPTEEQFQDPFTYIENIKPLASQFGIARIIPPPNFQPECRLADDVRFTSQKQFIHRMRSRWGPSTRDMVAFTTYLKTQQISLDPPPTIGGLDADLPRLYQVVEEMGGVKEVMDNWAQVAAKMNIPKSISNPKLQEMYFKYILPFVTLSKEEREGYFRKANIMWAAAKAQKKSRRRMSCSPPIADLLPHEDVNYRDVVVEEMDCVTKGKSMTYSVFARMSKNAMNMWFGSSNCSGNVVPEPAPDVVEKEFWKIVDKVDKHVVVHTASINTGDLGIGFPDPAEDSELEKKQPWNLKVMCSNKESVLRSMGTLMGVSIPTLHVGMVFTTSCWYRDPHGLPWLEYLHTGSPKIWYGLPESEGERFRAGFKKLAPFVCKDKKIWLPSDTTMIPPDMLRDTGVSLCRTVQNSGEYILVFPKAYSSSMCTGSCVSESVYLSPYSWLATAYHDFEDLHGSCEPSLFSLEHLLISIAEDERSNPRLLMHSHTLLSVLFEREKENRGTLRSLNVPLDERPARCEEGAEFPALARARAGEDVEECDLCKQGLHLSYVYDLNDEDQIYCLPHAIELITDNAVENYSNAVVHCKYSAAQLSSILKRLIDRLTVSTR